MRLITLDDTIYADNDAYDIKKEVTQAISRLKNVKRYVTNPNGNFQYRDMKQEYDDALAILNKTFSDMEIWM